MSSPNEDLCSKLQQALLHHQIHLQPVPAIHASREHDVLFDDPQLEYIRNYMLNDEEGSVIPVIYSNSYEKLLHELTLIASSPSSSPALSPLSPDSGKYSCAKDRHLHMENLLVECARCVTAGESRVYELIGKVKKLVSPSGCVHERTARYFVNALVARLTGNGPQMYSMMYKEISMKHSTAIQMNLPTLRATERFANQTIFDACRGAEKVHIVDYGIVYGCQWPSLIKALSERPEGPPLLKITGIDFPRIDVRRTGRMLVEYAKSCGLHLEFHSIASSCWEKVQPRYHLFKELLIVNCKLRAKHVNEEGIGESPRKKLFSKIASLNPAMFVLCEATMDLSTPFFLQRFQEAWRNFSIRMDMMEETMKVIDWSKMDFIEKYLEMAIMNVVACEGPDRVERNASHKTWDRLAKSAGFQPLPLREQAVNMAKSVWSGHNGFTFGVDENWLLLGWKDVTMSGLSAWKPIRPRCLRRTGMVESSQQQTALISLLRTCVPD